MKKKEIYKFILSALLIYALLIFYINQFNYRDNSLNSQQVQIPLKTAAEFEYYEVNGTIDDTTSIQIELPDTTWNITEIKLNFTNISQHRQLRTIEGNETAILIKELYYHSSGNFINLYGLEINFSETTQVFGVYLFGFVLDPDLVSDTEIVYVRFTGFDDNPPHEPNWTLYGEVPLNISNIPEWYYQDFTSSSLIFHKDEYYLLIDGEQMKGKPDYYFGFNEIDPTYPLLWGCERVPPGVIITYQGRPFLCKILQKINKTYFPTDLEMKAIIDESYYDIINGTQLGKGNLSLTNLNFKPDSINFNIPISINDSSLEIIYNVNYSIKLRKPISIIIVEVSSSKDSNDSQIFMGISPEFFFIVITLIIISFIAALTSYQAIKRIKTKREAFRVKISNKFTDILNLNYIMVCDKKSGVNVYDQTISKKNIHPTLISGFLQAIQSFGVELTGSDEQSQTIKLEYQNTKILMSEFKNHRIIIIFEENPSNDFMDALIPLSHEIDEYYGKSLENFDGEVSKFNGMKSLLEKHLQISLIYPLNILIPENIKLNKIEKSIIKKASEIMKQRNSDHFYASNLISEKNFNPKRAESILKLIDKKVFQPII